MPVTATRWLPPMRGGSQTHLVQASDGHHYVTKLTNNPKGLRTLINEWVAQQIRTHLRIPCPEVEICQLKASLSRRTRNWESCEARLWHQRLRAGILDPDFQVIPE